MNRVCVSIADYAVGTGAVTLATIGLGSCVAIVLHDPKAHIGALAHTLLPDAAFSARRNNPGRYAATAVPAMLACMRDLGAHHGIVARIVGGASMFEALLPAGRVSLGTRNIAAARAACTASGIAVIGEDVGGAHGRSVYLDVLAGTLRVGSLLKGNVSL